MPRPSTGNPTGVPKKEIDWNKVNFFLEAGCNCGQIASMIGVCRDTLSDRCLKEHGVAFSIYAQKGDESGKGKILATQYEVAVSKKDKSMLQYLGRVRLKQTDLIEQAQEEVDDLRKAVLEITEQVSGVNESLRQKLENAPSLQDQRPSREVHNISTQLGTEDLDGRSPSLSGSTES